MATERGAVTRVNFILDKVDDWFNWIFLRKDFAKDHKIWQYVNPDTPKESLPDLEASNPKPLLTDYKARATKLSDLSPEDRESYRWEVDQWRLDQVTIQRLEKALVDLNTEITRSIATRHLYLIQDLPTVHDRLVALKKHFCPSTTDRSRDLAAKYTNLKTAPRNTKALDQWMADWIHVTTQCQSINLPETSGYKPQEDFLTACQAHYPNYAATCLDQVYEHEINGTDLPSLPTYVEKMTKYVRRAAQTTESSFLSTSAAKLGIAKPPCICGLSHALHDCYILNPLHPS